MDIKVASTFLCQRDKVISLFETDLKCDFFRKFAYENIQRETTRLYFDLDLKNHPLGPSIRKEIIEQFEFQKDAFEFVYTDGSTSDKVSFHLIFKNYIIQKRTFRKEMARDFLKTIFTEDSKIKSIEFSELFKAIDNSVYKNQKYMRLPYGVCQNKPTPHIPQDITDMKEYFITYVKEDMKPFDCEQVPEIQKINFKGQKDSGENDPINIKKYKKNLMTLLERVDKKRFQDYGSWIELLFLMKGRELEEEDFIRFSKDSEYKEFDEEKVRDFWLRCDSKPMLGMTRVIDWCKEDSIDYMPLIYTDKEIKDKRKAKQKFEENKKEQEEEKSLDEAYKKMKEEFEEGKGKISSTGEFLNTINGVRHIQSKSVFITAYEHIEYDGLNESKKFIGRWIKDVNMKTYDKIECIPHTLPQNPRILNSWKEFPLHNPSANTDYQPFLKHIKILVNHDELAYNYVIKEIAHSIQYPHEKLGTMIVFAGEEGGGKGVYWDIRQELIGKYNCLRTPKIDEVAGQFNNLMSDKYLVCINENEFKLSKSVDGVLKDLITDDTININVKNQSSYVMASYHRFIMFTNSQELPVQTHSGDRRKLIIQTSSELIGNKDYFEQIYSYIRDPERIASFYWWLMTLDVKDFRKKALPTTAYQRDVQELFRSPVELWVENLAFTQREDKVKMTGTEQLESYTAYRMSQGINLELSAIALSMKLKLLKIKGVSDTIKGRDSNYREFDRKLLRQYFNLQED